MELVRTQLGPPNILVNNAGVFEPTLFLKISFDEWHRVVSVSLDGAFICAKECLPDMIASGFGRIVNLSSSAGKSVSTQGRRSLHRGEGGDAWVDTRIGKGSRIARYHSKCCLPGIVRYPNGSARVFREGAIGVCNVISGRPGLDSRAKSPKLWRSCVATTSRVYHRRYDLYRMVETNGVSGTRGCFDTGRSFRGDGDMRALGKREGRPGLWLCDVTSPRSGINDVLIRVHSTGICGTDLHIYDWDAWAQKTIPVPMVVGHEFVGEVVAVGSNVSDFAPGDLVSGEGHVVCGRCRNCLAGRRHLCAHTIGRRRQPARARSPSSSRCR